MIENRHEETLTFSTERLPLACFLHAEGRLKLVGCEPSGNGKVRFVFEDPDRLGDKLELDYEKGAVSDCGKRTFRKPKIPAAADESRRADIRKT